MLRSTIAFPKLEPARSVTNDAQSRLERKAGAWVDAVHRIMTESEQRLGEQTRTTERRFVDPLNERFDEVMVALDRFANPAK